MMEEIMKKGKVKLAVALYSFMHELRSHAMSFEECIAKIAELGASGVEILNAAHIPNWPNPSMQELRRLRKTVERYGLEFSCCTTYVDDAIRTNGRLTKDEMLRQIKRDLRHAHELGIPVMRLAATTLLDVALLAMEQAEKYNIKLGVEVHAPYTVDYMMEGGLNVARLKIISSPYFGVIPDMGGWAYTIPPRLTTTLVAAGFPKDLMDRLVSFLETTPCRKWMSAVEKVGIPEELRPLADLCLHIASIQDADSLASVMPFTVNIHGKFYDIDKNGEEPSIAYGDMLRVIRESGYDGYICSEYEGWAMDSKPNGIEMVRKHQSMMRRHLGYEPLSN